MKIHLFAPLTMLLLIGTVAHADSHVARRLAHGELVKRYATSVQLMQSKLASCKATSTQTDECWAANVANKLQSQPEAIRGFVLDDPKRDDRLTACARLAVDQRLNASDCLAAARADTFIAQVNPRTRLSLAPLKHF